MFYINKGWLEIQPKWNSFDTEIVTLVIIDNDLGVMKYSTPFTSSSAPLSMRNLKMNKDILDFVENADEILIHLKGCDLKFDDTIGSVSDSADVYINVFGVMKLNLNKVKVRTSWAKSSEIKLSNNNIYDIIFSKLNEIYNIKDNIVVYQDRG